MPEPERFCDIIKTMARHRALAMEYRCKNPRPTRRSVKPVQVVQLPGRNDPCHCGSGKKYKKCCEGK